jgi:hypothetical protein
MWGAQNPAFLHHLWYVHYHLEIVERLALELCDLYPSADRNLARLLRKIPMKNLFILPLILLTLGRQPLLSGSETKRDEFEGFYTAGFEVSSFVPCGDPGQPGYGKGYWLMGTAEFVERYNALVGFSGQAPRRAHAPIYVRFKGDLSPPGSHGHLGMYEREVTVIELLEMSRDGKCRGLVDSSGSPPRPSSE